MTMYRGSEIDTFLACRRKYGFEYLEEIEAVKPQKPLVFGTLMHQFIEDYNSTKDAMFSLLTGQKEMEDTDLSEMPFEEVEEMAELFSVLPCNYVKYWKHQDSRRETLMTEIAFRIPMGGGDWFVGKIDHIFTDLDTGLTWLEDHKTTDSIDRMLLGLEYNRQTSRYLYAVKELCKGNGEIMIRDNWHPITVLDVPIPKPAGMIFNIISKKVAKPPRVLQKSNLPGKLSLDKSQKTTYALYLDAVIAACGDEEIPEQYQEMLDFLSAQETPEGNQFFRRVPILRTDYETDGAFQTVKAVSLEIEEINDNGEHERLFRSEGQQCSWCEYKALCFAERAGENTDMIRETMYRPKEESPYKENDDDTEVVA